MSVLEVRNLTVEFGQRGGGKLRAVDNLSFELHEGRARGQILLFVRPGRRKDRRPARDFRSNETIEGSGGTLGLVRHRAA